MKYIIANWKCNKNSAEVKNWASVVSLSSSASLCVVVCPPFLHIPLLHSLLPDLQLGAQTLSPYPNGSYTGAISGLVARDFVEFAILGHVERRKYFHETNQDVANAAVQALDNKITPIIAVDASNWSSQLAQLSDEQLRKVFVMYEPAEAISTAGQGHAADLDEVVTAIKDIRQEFDVLGCLYGGSVDEHTVMHYMSNESIDGVVVGAASLDAGKFSEMIRLCLV